MDQLGITDVYRIFHLTEKKYFSSASDRTFSKINPLIGHKPKSLQIQKKTESSEREREIIPYVRLEDGVIKLEIIKKNTKISGD